MLRKLFAGGIDGNEQLTAMTGLILILLLAALGVTIAGAVVAGAVLAVLLIPHFGVWTARGALPHHN